MTPAKPMSTADAAKALRVSLRRVQQFISEGRLPAMQVGRIWLIDPKDLAKVRHRPTGRPPKEAKG